MSLGPIGRPRRSVCGVGARIEIDRHEVRGQAQLGRDLRFDLLDPVALELVGIADRGKARVTEFVQVLLEPDADGLAQQPTVAQPLAEVADGRALRGRAQLGEDVVVSVPQVGGEKRFVHLRAPVAHGHPERGLGEDPFGDRESAAPAWS